MVAYSALIKVVEQASITHLAEAQLAEQIAELGSVAVSIATVVLGLAGIIK